ncbi:MAG: ABC transporter permease [Sulfolobales archaeon]|nr:ABC transporter permease [Sulfolobales archaeon]MCX8209342.1 ABC transporter permease [Sulfolobales archaeon]MDW8010852.1 ABC transporter permease [Sulfolobales archaeon]
MSLRIGALHAARRLSEASLALAVGLAISSILILAYGYDPAKALYWLFYGGFGTQTVFLDSLAYATPLMLTGAAFAVCASAGMFNIGVEGQAYMGAVGGVVFGGLLVRYLQVPGPLGVLVALAGSATLGALWAVGPALLKVLRGIHEVISSIMFNWMAFYMAMYLVRGPIVNPARPEMSISVEPSARFSVIFRGSVLTEAIYFAVLASVLTYLVLKLTKLGFEIRLVGAGLDVARYAGISTKKAMVSAYLLSGALAGLGGGLIVTGRPPVWSIYGTLGNITNVGFDGIGVSLIAANNPVAVVFSSVLIGGLWNGSRFMEPYARVSSELSRAVIGLIVIALSTPEVLRLVRRLVMRWKT